MADSFKSASRTRLSLALQISHNNSLQAINNTGFINNYKILNSILVSGIIHAMYKISNGDVSDGRARH